MDTTTSREEFHKWWIAPEQTELRESCSMGWASKIWQASRASIEVELPEIYSNGIPACDEYDRAIGECCDVLRSAGLTVKGD